jgi:hypothetical protein
MMERFEQQGMLGFLTDYEFYLPPRIVASSPLVVEDDSDGVVVNLDVIWGPKYSIRAVNDIECFTLTGLFFRSAWSRVDCW